ncbi:hypothetical protein FDP41_004949 [Naegleria fowleri]|uniref:Inner membrane component domain-containing protein n=1 Tax=Naegleria fowleri TaxID=5763 RepID=A0A6A5BQ73_NAEFO|nr:uncharacterized protein FDP41_004949 [Naegleria fowleri]KAF0976274.1 hypothetical protein FDP41_004949 [Naegleria fowleri]CAG4712628.1 unnamed protein product [Naegleria fowleri]
MMMHQQQHPHEEDRLHQISPPQPPSPILLDDEYRDSFASLDDHPSYLMDESNHESSITMHPHPYDLPNVLGQETTQDGMTSIGDFVKTTTIPTLESTTSSFHHSTFNNNNHIHHYEFSHSSSPLPRSQEYRKEQIMTNTTIQRDRVETPTTDLSDVMLQEIDLGIPNVKIISHTSFHHSQHGLQNELKMLDDDGPSNQESSQQQHDSSAEKHKSVWSDLALQFLGRQVTDTFLTFEDSQQISVEMMQVLNENSLIVNMRKWLWRLSGGLIFSIFYALSACLIFVIYGFCFSLPCVMQLFRIAKFMSFPFTKLETYYYVLSRLNESNSELLASASSSRNSVNHVIMQHFNSSNRLSSTSSPIPHSSTLEKSNYIKSIKEHRELIFNSREKHGILLWIANLVWLLLFGWVLALLHLIFGGILILSVVGSEFGRRHLALVTLSLMPFGLSIKK